MTCGWPARLRLPREESCESPPRWSCHWSSCSRLLHVDRAKSPARGALILPDKQPASAPTAARGRVRDRGAGDEDVDQSLLRRDGGAARARPSASWASGCVVGHRGRRGIRRAAEREREAGDAKTRWTPSSSCPGRSVRDDSRRSRRPGMPVSWSINVDNRIDVDSGPEARPERCPLHRRRTTSNGAYLSAKHLAGKLQRPTPGDHHPAATAARARAGTASEARCGPFAEVPGHRDGGQGRRPTGRSTRRRPAIGRAPLRALPRRRRHLLRQRL